MTAIWSGFLCTLQGQVHRLKEAFLTAARLAQLGERRSAEREVVSSNPGRINTHGLKITEEKVLSL